METTKHSKHFLNPVSTIFLLFLFAGSIALYYFESVNEFQLAGMLIFSIYLASAIRIADQWEKAVVLRMGKYKGLKGPGLFLIIPVIDRIDDFIDQRVRVTDFVAEQTLTKDTVPVNVDAVVYWTVWDVEKAAPGGTGIR